MDVALDDILEMMNIFKQIYGGRYQALSKAAIEMWYKKFKNCDRRLFFKAIDRCTDIYKYPPLIPEVKEQYGLIENQWRKEVNKLKYEWEQITNWYPASHIDINAAAYLWHITMRFETEEDRLRFFQDMKLKIITHVKNHDNNKLPWLSELIKEIAYGGN